MGKRTLRVYLTTHDDGRVSGHLLPRTQGLFDPEPPAAYGESTDAVLHQLEALTGQLLADSREQLERMLWEETFQTRAVTLQIHPQAVVNKQLVVGNKAVPLRVTYAWSKVEGGGFRVMLPRFGWRIIVESLELAPDVLANAVSAGLVGEDARWLFEFRRQGNERVITWEPDLLRDLDPYTTRRETDADQPVLQAIAVDLVHELKRKRLDAVIGDLGWSEHAHLMWLEPPESLLLVGPSGVGKSAWVRGLPRFLKALAAERDADGDEVPKVWSTTADRVVAGMAYLGQWEKRCLDLVEELAYEGDYLHFGDLSGLIRSRGHSAIADLLLPAVMNGSISLITEATEAELERARTKAPAFVACFRVIRLSEPSRDVLPAMLASYLAKRRRGLSLHPQAWRRLIQFLAAFERDRSFPGKGIQFLEWLATEVGGAPKRDGDAAGGSSDARRQRQLDPRDITRLYAKRSGLPEVLISDEHAAGAEVLAEALRERVIGQLDACAAAGRALARFKAGMNDADKPLATLFFAGPTGVGKTELAKAIAATLFGDTKRLIRLDMSEYQLPGSAQRLLRVGRGVSSLAQQVRETPLSLVLLDEIEKADDEVFDLLLGLLGEGRLTDSDGRLVDFRMTFVVMTSNVGARERRSVGFDETSLGKSDYLAALRQRFRAEFVNRIDDVVAFNHLTQQDVHQIVGLELTKAASRTGFIRRELKLVASDAATAELARRGWHREYGARPLKRVIEEQVIAPIAVAMARSPRLAKGVVHVLMDDEAAPKRAAHIVRLGNRA